MSPPTAPNDAARDYAAALLEWAAAEFETAADLAGGWPPGEKFPHLLRTMATELRDDRLDGVKEIMRARSN